jgi:hypothetical protein
MAKETMKEDVMREVFEATPHLLEFPVRRMWTDFDKEADLLYIGFKRPHRKQQIRKCWGKGSWLNIEAMRLLG